MSGLGGEAKGRKLGKKTAPRDLSGTGAYESDALYRGRRFNHTFTASPAMVPALWTMP